MLLPSPKFGRFLFQFGQTTFCQCFIGGFEATADLLAAPFDERVISACLDDLVEVF